MTCWCEEGYGKKMMPDQLKEFLRNRFVWLTLMHGIIAKDNICEKLDVWIKAMPNPGNNEAFL